MKKKVLAITLALTTFAGSALAEQPGAAEVKNTLQSGKYYLEYEMDYAKKILAVQDNKRMDYTVYKSTGNLAAGMGLALINPLLGLGAMFIKNESKIPTAYYEAGKFYQFESKKKATMALWNQLSDPNLDPMENWNTVKQKLALPEELQIFAPKDMFAELMTGTTMPVFEESGSASIKGKEYLYDKYVSQTKSITGKVLMEKSYFMYYLDNELKFIKTYLRQANGLEQQINDIELKKLTSELPENILKIPEGCKVYAAGIGDMNDLLDQPVQVEAY